MGPWIAAVGPHPAIVLPKRAVAGRPSSPLALLPRLRPSPVHPTVPGWEQHCAMPFCTPPMLDRTPPEAKPVARLKKTFWKTRDLHKSFRQRLTAAYGAPDFCHAAAGGGSSANGSSRGRADTSQQRPRILTGGINRRRWLQNARERARRRSRSGDQVRVSFVLRAPFNGCIPMDANGVIHAPLTYPSGAFTDVRHFASVELTPHRRHAGSLMACGIPKRQRRPHAQAHKASPNTNVKILAHNKARPL